MARITAIGHTTIDIFVPFPQAHIHDDPNDHALEICMLWGQKYRVDEMVVSAGGNAANVSASLASLGIDVELVSSVGKDHFGRYAHELLEGAGIGTTHVQATDMTDTSIILSVAGDRTIIGHHADQGFKVTSDMLQSEWVFLTSCGAASTEAVHAIIGQYAENNTKGHNIAYNPGTAELQNPTICDAVFKHVAMLFVNLEEAGLLTGKVPTEFATSDDAARWYVEQLHAKGPRTVVITNGVDGAYASDGSATYFINSFPANVVEKTGAGDAFTGGVLAGIMHGFNISDALRWGAANSASVVEVVGASQGVLTRDTLQVSLSTFSDITAVAL